MLRDNLNLPQFHSAPLITERVVLFGLIVVSFFTTVAHGLQWSFFDVKS